jgi:hypothetical protein
MSRNFTHNISGDFDDDIETLRNDASFNGSFSIYPMPDDISLYKIHRFVLYMAHLEKGAVVIVWSKFSVI